MALVKYNNNSLSSVTSAAGFPGGALTHIKTLTASSSATLSFVHGSSDVVLDSTYPIYLFKFINLHGATDNTDFQFNMSTDGGSNYNVTKTSSYFQSLHNESDSVTSLGYSTGSDLAQGTGYQDICNNAGADADQSANGTLTLFNPSSTTFVKHFITDINFNEYDNYSARDFCGGYGNTTSAVDAVSFKFESGNIESGTIKLYGISDS
tara:strand:+ start:1467 stop:2090 length:624 start_codon:yes stop_codon:yes gene_type:complete